MDKKLIREIFVQYAVEVEGEHGEIWWSIPDEDVGIVVDTIAVQHEQEVAKLRGELSERRTICEAAQGEAEENFADLKLAQDDVARLRAQVAERTTALELQLMTFKKLVGRFYGTLQVYSGGYQMRDPDHLEVLLADADHALKEAPEHNLIWRGQAYAYPGVIDELVVLPDGKMSVSEEMEGIDPPKNAQLISLYAVLKGSEEEDG